MQNANTSLPLFVDLDGTLVNTDLLVESFLVMLKNHPLDLFKVPLWLLRGKACLKEQIALRASVPPEVLPYNRELLAFLREENRRGRSLYLATASNTRLAQAVADHLGIFSGVLASDSNVNLSGTRKLAAIQRICPGEFAYAGNDHVDIPIWNAAGGAIIVNAPLSIEDQVSNTTAVEAVFSRSSAKLKPLIKAMRPHQWLKNLLVFLPLLPIATSASASMLGAAGLAFIAFSLCASSVYLVNDLSDLAADRAHPRKCRRPFASGAAAALHGILLAPMLLSGAVLFSLFLPLPFLAVLLIYWVFTNAYTFVLKRYAMIDVLTLAGLYTLRVIGGAAAIAVIPSFWILAFSMFVFLSLALAKRYVELQAMDALNRPSAAGRGYQVPDLQLVQQMGVTSGYLSVLVMALYINSPEIIGRYGHGKLLWGLGPLLMLWISRIWFKATRGELNDDPLVFALKDKLSRIVLALAAVTALTALIWH